MKKILLYSLLLLTSFSCYKLEENDKRYTKKKLLKMLFGTWEIVDYQLDGTSYIAHFFTVNPEGNCITYTFSEWSGLEEETDLKSGKFYGECLKDGINDDNGFELNMKYKKIIIGSPRAFIDSVYFFDGNRSYSLIKLENSELILQGVTTNHTRKIYFKKA